MVVQSGNYCVPASAAIITTTSTLINTKLSSSAESAGNQGTFPRDMKLAMEKLSSLEGRIGIVTMNSNKTYYPNKKHALGYANLYLLSSRSLWRYGSWLRHRWLR